jgi:hypothetical protein
VQGSRLTTAFRTALSAPPFVNRLSPRRLINGRMVNRSAAGFISGPIQLKKWFISRQTRSLAPLGRVLVIDSKPLKMNSFLSLTNCPLNGI